MRVMLVDDHPLFRQGLRTLLETKDSITVVGEAGDGSEAVEMAAKMTPDVIVMDINMPEHSGLEATKQIKEFYPNIKIIILSRHADNIYVDQALKFGALGYVHKDAAYDELIVALEAVYKGRHYLSPAVLQPVVNSYMHATPTTGAMALYDKLTAREKEVFKLLAKGHSRSMMADMLYISPKTVDRHRSNLLKKLNLHNEDEIVQFTKDLGQTE